MSRKICDLTNELYRTFDILNEHYFDSSLKEPIITIQKEKPYICGHFISPEIWSDINSDEQYFEININPINLDRKIEDIIATLLHEMCHYFNYVNGINDTNGNKHNKKFKKLAESVDLIVDEDNYAITDPSDTLKSFISNTIVPNADDYSIFMDLQLDETDKKKKPRKKTQFKYICPKCGMVAKAKAELNIVCGACSVELEMEEQDEVDEYED